MVPAICNGIVECSTASSVRAVTGREAMEAGLGNSVRQNRTHLTSTTSVCHPLRIHVVVPLDEASFRCAPVHCLVHYACMRGSYPLNRCYTEAPKGKMARASIRSEVAAAASASLADSHAWSAQTRDARRDRPCVFSPSPARELSNRASVRGRGALATINSVIANAACPERLLFHVPSLDAENRARWATSMQDTFENVHLYQYDKARVCCGSGS